MSLLEWRVARRDDRDQLRRFECTRPKNRVRRIWGWEDAHPAQHELIVQSMIRERLSPVGTPGLTVLVGWDDQGDLGGISAYQALGSGAFLIGVIAVANRFRHRGGGWALEALTTTLDFVTADTDADGYSVARVGAKIHEANRPSQRLFESQRFEQTSESGDGYQMWAADFPVEGTLPF